MSYRPRQRELSYLCSQNEHVSPGSTAPCGVGGPSPGGAGSWPLGADIWLALKGSGPAWASPEPRPDVLCAGEMVTSGAVVLEVQAAQVQIMTVTKILIKIYKAKLKIEISKFTRLVKIN